MEGLGITARLLVLGVPLHLHADGVVHARGLLLLEDIALLLDLDIGVLPYALRLPEGDLPRHIDALHLVVHRISDLIHQEDRLLVGGHPHGRVFEPVPSLHSLSNIDCRLQVVLLQEVGLGHLFGRIRIVVGAHLQLGITVQMDIASEQEVQTRVILSSKRRMITSRKRGGRLMTI